MRGASDNNGKQSVEIIMQLSLFADQTLKAMLLPCFGSFKSLPSLPSNHCHGGFQVPSTAVAASLSLEGFSGLVFLCTYISQLANIKMTINIRRSVGGS